LEEELLVSFRLRVDVSAIDDDVLRKVRTDWGNHPERMTNWDWDTGICAPFRNAGPRGLDFALMVHGSVCGLAVARLSPRKRWISLTHIEGAPAQHELKGHVLAIVIRAMHIYRAVISANFEAEKIGVRILNPLSDAVEWYQRQGLQLTHQSKWLCAIEVTPPNVGNDREDAIA